MIGHELAIEQFEPAVLHTCHQPRKRDFRRIGGAREHALAKEGPAHGEAVQTADQFVLQPAFDAVRFSCGVQRQKRFFDIGVDPGFAAVGGRLGAVPDDGGEGVVAGNAKPILPYCLCQGRREVETLQRQDRTPFGFHPIGMRIIARIGHRENAVRIGTQQKVDVYRQSLFFPGPVPNGDYPFR